MVEEICEIEEQNQMLGKIDDLEFFIAGDISATNVLVGVYSINEKKEIKIIIEANYKGQEVQDFDKQVVGDLIKRSKVPAKKVVRKVFSPAAPISPDKKRADMTNASFYLIADENTALINDYAAIAYAIIGLGDDLEHISLKHMDGTFGEKFPCMKIGVHGAGTGFGTSRLENFVIGHDKGMYVPIDSEGGHKFLPVDVFNEEEIEITRWLYKFTQGRKPHYESVLSGKGIANIFDYYLSRQILEASCEELEETIKELDDSEHKAAHIASKAKEDIKKNRKSIFVKTMDFFWKNYGRALHDLAVHENARGGIWVAGGMMRKDLETYPGSEKANPYIEKTIMREFDSGPTHRNWVNKIPVNVIMDKRVGLKGAIEVACTSEYFEKERYKEK